MCTSCCAPGIISLWYAGASNAVRTYTIEGKGAGLDAPGTQSAPPRGLPGLQFQCRSPFKGPSGWCSCCSCCGSHVITATDVQSASGPLPAQPEASRTFKATFYGKMIPSATFRALLEWWMAYADAWHMNTHRYRLYAIVLLDLSMLVAYSIL